MTGGHRWIIIIIIIIIITTTIIIIIITIMMIIIISACWLNLDTVASLLVLLLSCLGWCGGDGHVGRGLLYNC